MSDAADPALDRSLRLRRPPALGRPGGIFDLSALPAVTWAGRSVSAAAVRDYCVGPGEPGRLDGLRVVGALDLSSMSFEQPLRFSNCLFTGPVNLTESRLGQIEFTGCTFAGGLSAKNLGCRALAMRSSLASERVDGR
jgi:Pentapeptide repeats (9 copies)